MFRFPFRVSLLLILPLSGLFLSACEETDLRYSGQTQYLGGIYGNQPTNGAPQDTVSYLGRR